MKILVSADMEGATGVTWPADCEPGTEKWQRCRVMFTSDVNAAVAGFLDGGADEVVINKARSTMRNLLLEELDERAAMQPGRHKDLTMVEGVRHGDVDGIAFLGYHTGAAPRASEPERCAPTFREDPRPWKLNHPSVACRGRFLTRSIRSPTAGVSGTVATPCSRTASWNLIGGVRKRRWWLSGRSRRSPIGQ